MTLPELLAKLPASMQTIGQTYGPGVLKMTADDLAKWLEYVFVGRYADAYAIYLKGVSDDSILDEWDAEHAKWVADNQANADKIALSNKIGLAVAKAMLDIVLAAVGL